MKKIHKYPKGVAEGLEAEALSLLVPGRIQKGGGRPHRAS